MNEREKLRLFVQHLKWQSMLAGTLGGVSATFVMHPLELVKIRFQVHEGQTALNVRPSYSGIMDATRSVLRVKGIAGLYQGVTPNSVGAGASWGLYFLFYNGLKVHFQEGNTNLALSPLHHIGCGYLAGAVTLCLVNPVWVVKTRLCLQYENELRFATNVSTASNVTATASRYDGMFDALRQIFRQEGFRGLYKGLLPGFFGVSHGALQFMAYEELKNRYCAHLSRPITSKLSWYEYLCCAALSKLFAATITYPYQVVRSRLQDQHRHYDNVRHVMRLLWRHEGIYGYYKGLVPNLLKVVPACCITFVVYENTVRLFS